MEAQRLDERTRFDLEMYQMGEDDPDWDDDLTNNGLIHGETRHRQVMSQMGQSMQDSILLSQTSTDHQSGFTNDEIGFEFQPLDTKKKTSTRKSTISV